MRVALSHDWLNGMRGGEKCLEILCELFPDSPIYTLLWEPGKVSETISRHRILTSWIQALPQARSHYRLYLPLFPAAVRSFAPPEADLVISTSHCAAKGLRKKPGAVHVCYCFTPMRYAWLFFEEYFGRRAAWQKPALKGCLAALRHWDRCVSAEVDHFIAISEHVRGRIREFYGRDSEVIYPPADTEFFTPEPAVAREDFYLIVSALVPYKRVDAAVRTFSRLRKPLVVVGTGPDLEALRGMAGSTVRFLGWQSDESIRGLYRRARALVFPGEEDFGIVPVEAQACGTPVIALGRGGALETILEAKTGIFYEAAEEDALAEAVRSFERLSFSADAIRRNAERFSKERFRTDMKASLEGAMRQGARLS